MRTASTDKLVFIYNAGSDVFSKVTDFAHKILSPNTYDCQLCAITHGHFSMENDWKEFIAKLPLAVEYKYKDEVRTLYPNINYFPAVVMDKRGKTLEFLNAHEINACKTLDDLKSLISYRLKEL